MLDWLHQLHDPQGLTQLISSGGLAVLALIIFSETGLLVGFFLPGDSLLFLAGSLCAVNLIDPAQPPPLAFLPVCVGLTLAAIAGNSLNWWLGHLVGDAAWKWPDRKFIVYKRRYLEQAHGFYQRWGALSLVLTRYVPVARTFVPFVAGMARMNFAKYTLWNVIGAVLWVPSLLAAGYYLGTLEFVKRHIETIILAIIAVSLAPMVIGAGIGWWRGRRTAPSAGGGDAGHG